MNMVTPTDRDLRQSIWDAIRFRHRVPVEGLTKQKLMQRLRDKLGLRKYQRIPKRHKGLFGIIRKSDFWLKSKYGDKLDFLQGRMWKDGEEKILKGLMRQGLKGKELHAEFNRKVTPNRTYMAVQVRASRLRIR